MLETGTASGHNDLLVKLHDFLVNDVGWTEMAYTPPGSPAADTDQVSMVLRAPGATSGNEYFLYLDSRADVGNAFYGWRMRAGAGYDSSILIGSQLLISPEIYFNTWNASINYWFYGSGRRVVVVAKVNTSYVSMYAGLFLPFALPSQYAKPFYLGGNFTALNAYNVNNTINRFLADPGQGCAYYLNSTQSDWLQIANHASDTTDVNFIANSESVMWPHRALGWTNSFDGSGSTTSWSMNGMRRMRPLTGGQVPLFICHILGLSQKLAIGTLDGVYSIPGSGKTSEQLLSFGSPARNFRAFQNVFRTTERDFMAVEET